MPICNTKNEFVFGWAQCPMWPLCPSRVARQGGAVFWLLLLLFVVTLGIALAGQRLLERHSSRGVKK